MEYTATVWDPHTTENIKKVEAVKRKAARFVIGDYRYTSSAKKKQGRFLILCDKLVVFI